ncbi:Hypothetical_protein [Hexamita inflata]|uniref:Hypothetical_protein n=1 Tax=Hexamita inflata TaxID=28002 RepID=A0AA86QRA6_9EUKA|nr:Hypothetical protein HINF_LOCUS46148 [Hexamita inflata]
MPFVISTNTSQLEIQWSGNLNAKPIDIQQFKDSYNRISIKGTNQQVFDYYSVLSRTQFLDITGCTINLSEIEGNLQNLNVNNCICKEDFTQACTTVLLYISDSQIQINQLLNLKVQSLSVSVSSDEHQFDYNNCCKLNCSLCGLTLINLNVDLQQLIGTWDTLKLENCILIGYIDKEKFKTQSVEVSVNEQNYSNNFIALDSLQVHSLYIKIPKNNTYQTISLNQLSNINKEKYIYAIVEQAICDLGLVTDAFSYINFTNCILICDTDTINTKLKNTSIEVQMNNQFQQFDYKTLQQNKIYDNTVFQRCKPYFLIFRKSLVDLDKLKGNWQDLGLLQCQFTNNTVTSPGSIKAQKIQVSKISCNLLEYFNVDTLEISDTHIVKAFPNANKLKINSSTVNVTEPNQTAKHLIMSNVKLIRFSVLTLPSLISIDLNYISNTDPIYSQKEAIIHFIRQKKKNRNILKQRLNRVAYEQTRIQNAHTRINYLTLTFNLYLCEHIQHSFTKFDYE